MVFFHDFLLKSKVNTNLIRYNQILKYLFLMSSITDVKIRLIFIILIFFVAWDPSFHKIYNIIFARLYLNQNNFKRLIDLLAIIINFHKKCRAMKVNLVKDNQEIDIIIILYQVYLPFKFYKKIRSPSIFWFCFY